MADRTSMNISLPESMRAWVEEIVKKHGYGTASEYFRELVRQDQQRREREAVEARLLEALDSGPMAEMTKADWEHIRREVRERIARRGGKKAG
jgi:antitoxin ParD1/3/4